MGLQGTYSPNKKKVINQSPDALVYLDGELSLPSGASPNRRVNIQPLINSVSVNLGIEQTPGNANFSLHIPEHYKDDLFRSGEPIIGNMMEVQIYMKGAFSVGGEPRFYPVFWGVTTSVDYSWNGGERTMDVSCEDILYWWNIQQININPSAMGADQAQIGEMNVDSDGYFTLFSPYDVMYTLARHAYGDSMNANVYGSRQMRPEMTDTQRFKMMRKWSRKWGRIRHALTMYGPRGRVVQNSKLADITDKRAIKARKKARKGSSKTSDDTKFEPIRGDGGAGVNFSEVTPFTQSIQQMGSLEIFTSDFKTKLDIANETKDAIGFEFFMDATGELIFKPPFYNLDVKPNKPVSWIRDIDIINESYSMNPPDVTFLEATGSILQKFQTGVDKQAKPKATYVDYRLVEKYGWKPGNYENEYITSTKALFYHLVDQLDRENLNMNRGSFEIPLRPELRLGYPVYVEHKDAYYYVESISHQFSYGSSCTTSIEVKGRRTKFHAPFDSWAAGEAPKPGDTAPTGVRAENLYNRPVDEEAGEPEPDRNVNMVFREETEEEAQREKDKGGNADSFEVNVAKADKVRKNLVSMRTQFDVSAPADYVYQIDPERDEPIERDDEGKKISGPLTSLRIEEKELEHGDNNKNTTVNVASFPVSDEKGYEVIGSYEYGRSASIIPGEGITLGETSRRGDVDALLHLQPDSGGSSSPTDNQVKEKDNTTTNAPLNPRKDRNIRVHPNNYGRRIQEITPDEPSAGTWGITSTSRGSIRNLREEGSQQGPIGGSEPYLQEFAERLDQIPDALPSDIQVPNDPSLFNDINDYLQTLYQRAFEENKAREREFRGLTKQVPGFPDAQSVPTEGTDEDDLIDNPLDRNDLQDPELGSRLSELSQDGEEGLSDILEDFRSQFDNDEDEFLDRFDQFEGLEDEDSGDNQ